MIQERLKTISLVLLLAAYFVASNGMVVEYAARWYSTGGQAAIALHSGSSRELPVPSLTQRTYLPLTSPITLLSVALLAHTIVYPVARPLAFVCGDEALPWYAAGPPSALSDRAPPTA